MKPLITISIILLAILVIVGFFVYSNIKEATQVDYLPEGYPNNTESQNNTPSTNTPSSQTYNIEIKSFSFRPNELIIKAGDTVTWTNKDSTTHIVKSNSGNELFSPPLSEGENYSHIFTQAGSFSYHCSLHPGMKGTITVE